MVGATVLFVFALSLLPLTEATAATFTGPLFVTALAPRLLGEQVGWRRWSAHLLQHRRPTHHRPLPWNGTRIGQRLCYLRRSGHMLAKERLPVDASRCIMF